jgi:hypothetical protein
MPGKRNPQSNVVQAWIELRSADPEAVSAVAVARAHLPAGRSLAALRRLRLFELSGPLPIRAGIEKLLQASIQFYNPHKERCVVRVSPTDAPPVAADEPVVLVYERGEERREGAERWWRHETGRAIEVREGVVWVLGFGAGVTNPAAEAEELTVLRDRRHGLLCNPHAQEYRIAAGTVPLPWMNGHA